MELREVPERTFDYLDRDYFNAINTKLSDFCLIYASSEGSGESVHWHKFG